MNSSYQLIVCLLVVAFAAQSLAISCSQCVSTPGKFSTDCQVGIQTVKACPPRATSCVLKTITPQSPHGLKDVTIFRSCATPSRDLGCVTTSGQVTCTRICSEDACNVGPIPRQQPSTTTEATTTTTTTESQQATNRCYQCNSRNGRNPECASNPSISSLQACPADKPHCQIKITTSTFFARAHTVERSCSSHSGLNNCVSHGRGFINTCFQTCTGDGCNRGASGPQQPTTTTATTTTTTESVPTAHRCYKCISTNGQNPNCETNPGPEHIHTCPDDKPFCTTKITTSSVYTSVRTVQRGCFETNSTQCVQYGNGLINACFSSCNGDLCNE